MKTLVALALLISTAAFAAPPRPRIQCHSTGVADAGYGLIVASDQRSALLSGITFAGSMPLASLRCVPLLLRGPGHPDEQRNFLLCNGISRRLGNVAVRLYTPGFAGLMTASVRRVSFFGGRRLERELRFGNLICPLAR